MLRSWIIYVVMLILSAVFNRLYPGYISSLTFYVILFVPFVSGAHLLLSHFTFFLSHKLDKNEVSKGEKITYTIKLFNPTVLLFVPYSLHYVSSDRLFVEAKDDEKKSIIIYPRGRVTFRKELTCQYRGNYSIGVDKIIMKDFFLSLNLPIVSWNNIKFLYIPNLGN